MEHFRGSDHTVHLSTGGTYELFRALIGLARRSPEDTAADRVAAFLESRLRSETRSGSGFDVEPLPEEIRAPEQRLALGRLVAAFAAEVAKEHPDAALCDVSWDRDLRVAWLARLLDLHAMLLTEAGRWPGTFPLELPPEDAALCEIEQLLNREGELVSRTQTREEPRGHFGRVAPEAVLPLIARVLELAEKLTASPKRADLRRTQLEARADVYLGMRDLSSAATTLRQAAEAIDDPEYRAATLEYADSLDAKDAPTR